MAKPDDPGAQGRGRGKLKSWADRGAKGGFEAIKVAAGDANSATIEFDPVTQDLAVKHGVVLDGNGRRLKGRNRPDFRVDETPEGAVLYLADAATSDLVFFGKVVDAEPVEDDTEGEVA